jgi:transcriptional regulator with GAF, ATPase, and Fis domain
MSEALLLTVEQSDGRSKTQPLVDGAYDIGRGTDNLICIQDQGISRRHARLVVSGAEVAIEDLDSKNGVLVNGQRIEHRTLLRDGDQVVLGMAFLTLHRQDLRVWIDPAQTPSGGQTVVKPVEASSDLYLETASFDQRELVRATDDVKRLWLLYHTGRAAAGLEPLAARLRHSLDYVRVAIGYERALLLLQADPGGRLEPAAVRSSGPASTAVDKKLVAKALEERSSVLTAVTEPRSGAVRSVLCVPLVLGDRELGLLYVEGAPDQPRYTSRDLDLLTAVASQLAFAVENDRLIGELKTARDRLADENVNLKEEVRARYDLTGLVAQGPAMEVVRREVRKVLARDSTLLVLGESGTGKEVLAKTIHYNGPRAERPFVALNCAAIPENLLESELFGIEAGVATGVGKRIGRFEQAADGTLFLDEIGELSLPVQAKLLRVLEERTFERVGGNKPIEVQARIITATNRDLLAEVRAGRFREDLYYRLAVIPIVLPPLRKRKEDIPALVEHFLKRHADRPVQILREAMDALLAWDWPGNVRELSNEIERAVALAEGNRIGLRDLSQKFWDHAPGAPAPRLEAAPEAAAEAPIGDLKTIVAREVERIEKSVIERALQATGQNKLRTAKLLGLSREGLRKKMMRHGMAPENDE